MTTEQILDAIVKLPAGEKKKLFARLGSIDERLNDDDKKWEQARRDMAGMSGALDLGEQLIPVVDRDAIYKERF
ncbi:MAG: hypothetical protein WC889_08435 [Myxococcota bacterium]|jgi:hypothetical protein